MKKAMAALICVAVIAGIALTVVWPYMRMGFASSAYYTDKDKREYAYYTPELLKKMPRISEDYQFEFGNVSGPQADVFTVRYYGATDTRIIHRYLISVGYHQQAKCDVEAECWRSLGCKDIVTVIKYTSPDSIVVQIYRSPYND